MLICTLHKNVFRSRGNTQVLIFCWFLLLFVKIDAASQYDVNIKNNSHDFTKK